MFDKYNTKNVIRTKNADKLQKINAAVAGIDIGAESIFVCAGKENGSTETRKFGTFTVDLNAMAHWLKECKVTSIAMESTGVYWIPPYEILEEKGFEVVLTNAYHVKALPGRKTDVQDCEWLQQLHSYGLIRGSFRPKDEYLVLRSYVRTRSNLIENATSQINLMHKALIQMNIQLSQVVSHISSNTGMKIIRSIIAGERDPVTLAKHRDPRCKSSQEEIAKALEGNWRPEHIFSLKQAVEAYDFFQAQILDCEKNIQNTLEQIKKEDNGGNDFSEASESNIKNQLLEKVGVDLTEIPGLKEDSVVKIISEVGIDMTKFPTVKHFTSWLGLCPENKISGGRILSSKSRPTANKAAQAFRMGANAVSRSKTALGAFFRRIRGRIGGPKAITATAHKLAKIFYYMLRDKTSFHDIGQEEFHRRYQERTLINLRKTAALLGFELVEKELKIA